jgi:peroxiredoxin Q/BCP
MIKAICLNLEDEYMSELVEGAKAPAFTLKNSEGESVKLSDFKGSRVILYFYPKDDTPGCTAEACDFRDSYKTLMGSDTVVLGVSPDTTESHKKFRAKYSLPFELLADSDKKVATLFGAYGEKKSYGKISMGIIRSTFVIGPDGRIEKIYRNVKATGHVERVIGSL